MLSHLLRVLIHAYQAGYHNKVLAYAVLEYKIQYDEVDMYKLRIYDIL